MSRRLVTIRERVEVTWRAREELWLITQARNARVASVIVGRDPLKSAAVATAAAYCRNRGERYPVELVIKNKNGRVSKGGDAPRTYPRSSDPERSRG